MTTIALVPGHVPVMRNEVIACLEPVSGESYIDGTFGAGGYSHAVLEAADTTMLALDQDPDAATRATAFKAAYGERFHFFPGRFGDMEALLGRAHTIHGVMLDIGVSSFQLDEAARGFSFQSDGPLDMRMAHHTDAQTAADVVNSASEAQLADIFYHFGEERDSRRIAAAIVHDRADQPFTTTRQLASLLERLNKKPRKSQSIHPATRVFQALRIFVNDELGELQKGLAAAERLLQAGGRLIVVTFHSLEDRIVKQFLARRSGAQPGGSRHLPPETVRTPSFIVTKKSGLKPTDQECADNPRARSARLRWGVRTEAEAWPQDTPEYATEYATEYTTQNTKMATLHKGIAP